MVRSKLNKFEHVWGRLEPCTEGTLAMLVGGEGKNLGLTLNRDLYEQIEWQTHMTENTTFQQSTYAAFNNISEQSL